MLGLLFSRLRTPFLTLAGLLLASGAAWAHGGGHGGGGGGHGGGHGGVHMGGFGHGVGVGHVGGFGVGRVGGFGNVGNVGGFRNFGVYSPGFSRGLGYSPYFGRPYLGGYRYTLGRPYNYYGLGYGVGLGYGLSYGSYGRGLGFGYPYSGLGLGYGTGWPYLGYNAGWYGGIYPSNYYGYNSSPYYGYNSAYGVPPTAADYGMLASRAEAPPPPKDDMAHLLVIVPENAELWFNGTKTTQTGPQREFISPELATGKKYNYEIKARWTENGKPVEQVRTAHVQANNWQVIDFTKAEPPAQEEKK